MKDSLKQRLRPSLKRSEGEVPYMYLDTEGLVTVGVGNMLRDVVAAQALPFVDRKTRKKATKDQIKTDYETVRKQTKGRLYTFYKPHTKLDLPQVDIDRLLNARIDEFLKLLKGKFPDFDDYPMDAQEALFDMAYNLGVAKLMREFTKFVKAVKDQDWETAAAQCKRGGISETRNRHTRELFEKAAKSVSSTAATASP